MTNIPEAHAIRDGGPPSRTARASARFAAGAVAVLTAHQTAVWALHAAGVTPWPAYSLAPTRPLGVPQVLSAAFWGGAWWVALSPLVERGAARGTYWTRAAAFGAAAPTAVGALLVAAGRAFPRGGTRPAVLLGAGLLVNALWGLASAALRRSSCRGPRVRRGARTSLHPAEIAPGRTCCRVTRGDGNPGDSLPTHRPPYNY